MTQKITSLVNCYAVTGVDGRDVLAFAEQKRFALREELTFRRLSCGPRGI